MASFPSLLTPAQSALLAAFFERTRDFFLTGGTALAGFYLGHRVSADLDLFTTSDEPFRHGRRLIEDACRSLGAGTEVVREFPGYIEMRAILGAEALKLDLCGFRKF